MKNSQYKPFLRWAGGKSWLLNTIDMLVPSIINNYYEPFLGGGSVFFHIRPNNKVFLSDSNEQLINTYIQVRDNIEELLSILITLENTSERYYQIRSTSYHDSLHQAAKFIYLNRTSFNGIYRVNRNGNYNVPYGHKKYAILFDVNLYNNASRALQRTEINTCDFTYYESRIAHDDLVILDPPYTATQTNNGFIKYNEKLFSWSDQERLARFIKIIRAKGVNYILTNAEHPEVYRLFSDIDKPITVSRYSVIGGKQAQRKRINEYVFSNLINSSEESSQ